MSKTRRHTHRPPSGNSKTQQQYAKDQDINTIMARHAKGAGRFGRPVGDPNATAEMKFAIVPSESFHDMLNKVTDVQNQFRDLPSRTRSRYGNDPYQWLRHLEALEKKADEEAKAAAEKPSGPEFGVHRVGGGEQQQPPRPDPEANPRMSQNPPNPA